MDPVIIIGGGIAGVTCAKSLSIDQPNLPKILISSSSIVKTIANFKTLGRSIDMFDVIEQNAQTLKSKNLDIIINKKVIEIDPIEKHIRLDDDQCLKYCKLCICTGARPKKIETCDDVDTNNDVNKYIKYIRDTQTAKDFTDLLKNSERIMIAGNGGIATEIVYAVNNIEIIWSIRDDTISSVFFDAGAAKFFTDFLDKHGPKDKPGMPIKRARYHTDNLEHTQKNSNEFGVALGPDWSLELSLSGNKTKKKVVIEKNVEIKQIYAKYESIPEKFKLNVIDDNRNKTKKWNIYVHLTNEKIYGCDMLIAAIGVIPNSDIPIANGEKFELADDKGILIDREMRTNFSDIYAAGDVCTIEWTENNENNFWFQMRLWTQARQMGFYSSKCIQWHLNLSTETPVLFNNFDVFAHVTQFFGFRVIFLGLFDEKKFIRNSENGKFVEDYKILCRVIPKESYIKVILKNHKMIGAILIGDNNLEETFEFLIYNQIDLSRFGDHLLDDHLDIEDFFD